MHNFLKNTKIYMSFTIILAIMTLSALFSNSAAGKQAAEFSDSLHIEQTDRLPVDLPEKSSTIQGSICSSLRIHNNWRRNEQNPTITHNKTFEPSGQKIFSTAEIYIRQQYVCITSFHFQKYLRYSLPQRAGPFFC